MIGYVNGNQITLNPLDNWGSPGKGSYLTGIQKISVYFHSTQKPNSKGEAEAYYMVALPNNLFESGSIVITKELLSQAYYSKSYKLLYFRLEEEQYYEITKSYFDAEELASEALKDVSFSFEELFEE